MSLHTDLVDAVNNAKTDYEHTYADAYLQGWRRATRDWSFAEADMHTARRFGDHRPMCCGVLLDWAPDPKLDSTSCNATPQPIPQERHK